LFLAKLLGKIITNAELFKMNELIQFKEWNYLDRINENQSASCIAHIQATRTNYCRNLDGYF